MKKSISLMLVLVMLITLVPFFAFGAGSNLKASDQIVDVIKSFEGYSEKAHKSTPGEKYYTIGYGHYGADVAADMKITEEKAVELLRSDLSDAETRVNKFFEQYNLSYPQQVFDAVLSLTYNIGSGWMNDPSYRIRNCLINGLDKYDDLEIADALGVICRAGDTVYTGLIKRRIKEARILLYGDYTGTSSPNFVYLNFNAGQGTLNGSNSVKIFAKGKAYGPLPVPYRVGYTFSRWQTAGGAVISSSNIANEDLTVNAVWSPGTGQKYALTVSGGTGSGSYVEGTPVTISPTSSSFLIWCSGDTRVLNTAGKYSLDMPGHALEITAINDYNCEGKTCHVAKFIDVPSDYWAHKDIDFVYENNLFKGCSDTEFMPKLSMNRGMLLTVLYRINGSPSVSGLSNPFTDVAPDSYYHDAVVWGYYNHIVNGVSESSFSPIEALTREQLATFLLRYSNYMGYVSTKSDSLSGYGDADLIADYAFGAVSWAVGCGIINGVTTTSLSPQTGAERAQVAAMISRFIKNVAAGAKVSPLT